MSTAQDVLNVARGQIGYHESGVNITKFWAELDPALQGQPWCLGFASWSYTHSGQAMPAIDRPYGAVSALDVMNYAKAKGLWSSSGLYAPGDLIIFGGGEHGAICESDDGKTLTTIDGNWGDQVIRVSRSHGVFVSGAFQMSKLLSVPTTKAPVGPLVPSRNIPMTMAIQAAVHVTADGYWGDITSHAASVVIDRDLSSVTYLQARVGTVQDGFWGPHSEAARIGAVVKIQLVIGVAGDGAWGPISAARWALAYSNNFKKY